MSSVESRGYLQRVPAPRWSRLLARPGMRSREGPELDQCWVQTIRNRDERRKKAAPVGVWCSHTIVIAYSEDFEKSRSVEMFTCFIHD